MNMATNYTERRTKLLGLPTHQHRLRHLKSVAVRNLNLSSSIRLSDITKLQTYFSIHADVKQKAFYESEVIFGSLNPNFKNFDLTLNPAVNTSSSYFVIRLWAGQDGNYKLVIEWIVDLCGLTYLGENIHNDDYKYKPDTLLYGMFDGVFGAMDEKQILEKTSKNMEDILLTSVKVDQASVRTSYTTNSLSRVLTVMRAIKQTENSVKRVRRSIEDRLIKSRTRSEKLAEHELSLLRVQQCRDELTQRTQTLQRDTDSQDKYTLNNHTLDIDIKKRFETLDRDKERLHDKRKYFFECRENYIKTNSQLFIRRKQLISELAVIYPIHETAENKFTICGVHLPNSEDFQGVDDTRINVALGKAAHLVLMVCHFLDIRPRYQIDHLVSRSTIHDHIIERTPDNDIEFPLYGRRKDRFRFNYAVFLLNKTIAQLRDYCGLGTKDLRLTLPNLKSLLELRLGVKFDMTSASTSYRRNLLSDRALLQRVGRLPKPFLLLDNIKSQSDSNFHVSDSNCKVSDSNCKMSDSNCHVSDSNCHSYNEEQVQITDSNCPVSDSTCENCNDEHVLGSNSNSNCRFIERTQSSPQRSRDSSFVGSLELYKSITPDYSPKTQSNGLGDSEDGRHGYSSSLDNVRSSLTQETADFTSLNNDNIDTRVSALTTHVTSFKLTQATSDHELEESRPDTVVGPVPVYEL